MLLKSQFPYASIVSYVLIVVVVFMCVYNCNQYFLSFWVYIDIYEREHSFVYKIIFAPSENLDSTMWTKAS